MKTILSLILLLFIPPLFAKSSLFDGNAFTAKITQEVVISSGQLKRNGGVLHYQYPHFLKMELNSHEDEKKQALVFVKNHLETIYYTPPGIPGEKGQAFVQKKAASKDIITYFFNTLYEKGLVTNNLFSIKEEKRKAHLLFNQDIQKSYKVKMATVHFNTRKSKKISSLKKIIFKYLNGKQVTFTFDSLKMKQSIAKKSFSFKIPKNTHVSQN